MSNANTDRRFAQLPPAAHLGTSRYGRDLHPTVAYILNTPSGAYAFRSRSTASKYKGTVCRALVAGNLFHGVPAGQPAKL